MAINGTINLNIKASGDGINLSHAPAFGTNGASPGQDAPYALAQGDNEIAIPANTRRICIQPPDGNTAALTFRTVQADTGVPIGTDEATLWSLPKTNPPANFYLNASSAVTVRVSFT